MPIITVNESGDLLIEIQTLGIFLESDSSSREFHLLVDSPYLYIESKNIIGEDRSFYLSVFFLEVDIESKVSIWLKLYLASVTYTYFERRSKLIIGFLNWILIFCRDKYPVIKYQDLGWTR